MSELLNEELLSEVMEKALENGSKAFSAFIGRNVEMSMHSPEPFIPADVEKNGSETSVVLISDLKGELAGKSYLIFINEDAKEFCAKCLPAHYLEDTEMREAVLLEFDNIITAAVVTVLSKELKKNCYAYVPAIEYIDNTKLYRRITQDFNEQLSVVKIKSVFSIEGCQFEPLFIWAIQM